MGSITITQLYEQLSSKFGKDSAETMTSFIDHKIKEDMADNMRMLATKHDLAEGLAAARVEMAQGLAVVSKEIGSTRSEMIKWMFIFWASLFPIIWGMLELFFKK
jgi:hypothetical protein